MIELGIEGNLEEMCARAHDEKIKTEEKEEKLEEMLFLKKVIIKELDEKYHFNRMCILIDKFNDFLPSLIDYIDSPNQKSKKSLKKKIEKFIECMEDG